MHALIVKLSSMGDIIHTLPALTDATDAYPHIQFDWVVEHAFQCIPAWHFHVKRVIPIGLRQWRKHPLHAWKQGAWTSFYQALQTTRYDCVIDPQGLLKSAAVSRCARSRQRIGFDRQSARESMASAFYTHRFFVPKHWHAITRTRALFSHALGYTLAHPDVSPCYSLPSERPTNQTIIFIHGSSRDNKCWPEEHWLHLAKKVNQAGKPVHFLWGNETEQRRAIRLAQQCDDAHAHATPTLNHLLETLARAHAVVTVDTGPGHLAAALNRPTVGLYGPTNPDRCGLRGPGYTEPTHPNCLQHTIKAGPSMAALTPAHAWDALNRVTQKADVL